MGDIKRKKKKYSRPKKLYDKERIDVENALVKEYGLKNKREIWKAKAEVGKIRRRAKSLISSEESQQQKLFDKLNKMGFEIQNISDVLALTEKDLLNRRLQTFIVKKGLVTKIRQARQLIVHKHVLVDGKIVNTPSFIVPIALESTIKLKERKAKPKKAKEEKVEKMPNEEVNEEKSGEEKQDGKK